MPTLEWIGKNKIINHHLEVPYRVLVRQYSFDENGKHDGDNGSENMIIHGDNLDVLKSLLPRYKGKIDCIYIDPPYNTGNEKWSYNDNVNDPRIMKWLNKIVGREGEDLSRHDKWLCMMYPRTKLLRELLSDNGVIFISLNYEDEYAFMRLVCDEIFGKRNFVAELTWESTTQPINAGSAIFNIQQKIEPILCYAKEKQKMRQFILEEVEIQKRYPYIDETNGKPCRYEIIEKSNKGSDQRSTMTFPILGQFPRKGKRWQIGKDTASELEARGRLKIIGKTVKKVVYPEDELCGKSYRPFWSHFSSDEYGSAQTGKKLFNDIMGGALAFDTVKSRGLMKAIFSHFPSDAIFLDAFAGTGTTAHAILDLNKEDAGKRKFILVEAEPYTETITAERVKRVIQGYTLKDNSKVEGSGGSFNYYEIGEQLLTKEGDLNKEVQLDEVRAYIWYTETRSEMQAEDNGNPYYLGTHNATAYYFYYKQENVTTLNHDFLATIPKKEESTVIYADRCTLASEELERHGIIFKKVPRDITKF